VLGAMKTARCAQGAAARTGFTLVELLIVVAVLAVILTLAAPSFRDMIEMQRLRGTSAQLTTDIQFARSEAASRQENVAVTYKTVSTMTCYIVHTKPRTTTGQLDPALCDCTEPAGSRCPLPSGPSQQMVEIRTVQVPTSSKILIVPIQVPSSLSAAEVMIFDPSNGGMQSYYIGAGGPGLVDLGEAWAEVRLQRASNPPALRTRVSRAGRPSVCNPDGRVSGVPSC
jgi:type IV fimbrial biogenesis protein FimT